MTRATARGYKERIRREEAVDVTEIRGEVENGTVGAWRVTRKAGRDGTDESDERVPSPPDPGRT